MPTSNVLVSTGAIAASRFVVPGLVGLALALALPLGSRMWGRGVLAALVLSFAALSWREVRVWSTPEALFEAQAARSPQSAYALVDHALLGGSGGAGDLPPGTWMLALARVLLSSERAEKEPKNGARLSQRRAN